MTPSSTSSARPRVPIPLCRLTTGSRLLPSRRGCCSSLARHDKARRHLLNNRASAVTTRYHPLFARTPRRSAYPPPPYCSCSSEPPLLPREPTSIEKPVNVCGLVPWTQSTTPCQASGINVADDESSGELSALPLFSLPRRHRRPLSIPSPSLSWGPAYNSIHAR